MGACLILNLAEVLEQLTMPTTHLFKFSPNEVEFPFCIVTSIQYITKGKKHMHGCIVQKDL